MDELWESPAKVNLTVRVGRIGPDGYHPIDSIVQAIDWRDTLRIKEADEDELVINGADLPTDGENLVWRAVDALGLSGRPRLRVELTKSIPDRAGLGGGSSNAACMIAALGAHLGLAFSGQAAAAARAGADVTFFLRGGTARLSGNGSAVEGLDTYPGFVLGVAVPDVSIATAEAYRRWDDLGGPSGSRVPASGLPPSLRNVEIINDLTPAAIDLEPQMADVMADLAESWGRSVLMSGSGSALFSFFADLDEASSAVAAVSGFRIARAVSPIGHGVRIVDR